MNPDIEIAMMGVAFLLNAGLGIWLWFSNKRAAVYVGELQVLQVENLSLHKTVEALTDRIAQLERQVQHLSRRQNQLELRDPVTQTYEPAIRMVRKGADVEELVSTCGLARGEAELIMMLHRNVAVAPAAARRA